MRMHVNAAAYPVVLIVLVFVRPGLFSLSAEHLQGAGHHGAFNLIVASANLTIATHPGKAQPLLEISALHAFDPMQLESYISS